VISLLNEPNTFSPANVDASVMYRKWKDSKGKDREYIEIIRYQEGNNNNAHTAPFTGVTACHRYTKCQQCRSVWPHRSLPSVFPPRRKQVVGTKAEAERDGVKVPITLDEYCVRTQVPPTDDGSNLLYDDYYDDEELADDDDDNEDCCYDDDDSGTEAS